MTRPPEIKGLEAEIEVIVSEKEAAIKDQDFENAAALRDKEKNKDRKSRTFSKPGAMRTRKRSSRSRKTTS
jgi:protein-arginine kinase activator protein McsA